jgi:hypothetical protein
MDYHRNYRPCSTFFVEDDYGMESRVRQERQAKEEHQKLVARERQYAMADELSHLTSEELRDDILSHMLEMDVSLVLYLSFLSDRHTDRIAFP